MKLYIGSIDCFDSADRRAVSDTLDAAELQKTERLQREEDKARTLLGRYLALTALKRANSEYGGDKDFVPVIVRDDRGKPRAVNSDMSFSISHSGKTVMCEIDDMPIGVDDEEIKPCNPRIAGRICTERELEYVLGGCDISKLPLTDGRCTDRAFLMRLLRVWTAKEAFFKCIGTGITDLKSADIFDMEPHLCNMDTDDCICTLYSERTGFSRSDVEVIYVTKQY